MRGQHFLAWFLATFALWQTSASAQDVPATPVEGQPLAANLERLAQALDYLGAPLAPETAIALREAGTQRDSLKLQSAIDPHVLFVVQINPESRVKVARGPGPARLQQAGYTPVIVKVINQGDITKRLRVHSPQSGTPYTGEYLSTLERQQQTALRSDPGAVDRQGRFLHLEMFTAPPMTTHLSGLEVEYAVALIHASEAGRREATIAFDVDQGTQDLGFRGETPVLFNIRRATTVRLSVREADGTPSTARLTFRDHTGRVFPPQAKRLAPDFFFQPQIYRADGETVTLPPGELTMQSSRGPEYRLEERTVTIPDAPEATLDVHLKRWIDPPAFGYFGGDHHIHSAGCAHYSSPTEGVVAADIFRQVKGEGLNVGNILNWGFCFEFQRQFHSPKASEISEPRCVIKYDIEISGFGSAALGHVCLLNLTDHVYPGSDGIKGWPTWATPALRWAKQQGAFTGYPHSGSGMQIDPPAASARMMAAYDADKNQALSVDEAAAALLSEPFAKIDVNRDQVLSLAELERSLDRIAEQLPNLGVPEAPLEICAATALGVCDFISAMDTPRGREWNTWYHLMNCGFPLKTAGETDFPCMSGTRVGQGRTYVQLGPVERIDVRDWCAGLAQGRSYVSDGFAHAINFAVNGVPAGGEIKLAAPGKVVATARVAFSSQTPREVAYGLATPAAGKPWIGDTVTIHPSQQVPDEAVRERLVEVVVNGQVVARQKVPADDQLHEVKFNVPIERSSWVTLRQFPQLHTNPVNVLVGEQPIRASRASARWGAEVVEQLWRARERNIAPAEREAANQAFNEAIQVFRRIAEECPAGT
ncbi:MAG: CehA/McbA family metallohydrolase [Planctomycetes bacterium]|nr:CehA/McbA family metallohydrolase [Planctomycetota bacterium]